MEFIVYAMLAIIFLVCAGWVLMFLAELWPITVPLLIIIICALLA